MIAVTLLVHGCVGAVLQNPATHKSSGKQKPPSVGAGVACARVLTKHDARTMIHCHICGAVVVFSHYDIYNGTPTTSQHPRVVHGSGSFSSMHGSSSPSPQSCSVRHSVREYAAYSGATVGNKLAGGDGCDRSPCEVQISITKDRLTRRVTHIHV